MVETIKEWNISEKCNAKMKRYKRKGRNCVHNFHALLVKRGHSESLRPSDMGSVQNLIGMPSNGYVPKVAV